MILVQPLVVGAVSETDTPSTRPLVPLLFALYLRLRNYRNSHTHWSLCPVNKIGDVMFAPERFQYVACDKSSAKICESTQGYANTGRVSQTPPLLSPSTLNTLGSRELSRMRHRLLFHLVQSSWRSLSRSLNHSRGSLLSQSTPWTLSVNYRF